MTVDELARVLDKLNAGWPERRKMPDSTLGMWREELLPLDFSAAFAAARALAREAERFPKPAEFVAVYGVHKHRQSDGSTRVECDGCESGWVIVADGVIPTVKPCPRCRRPAAR